MDSFASVKKARMSTYLSSHVSCRADPEIKQRVQAHEGGKHEKQQDQR